MSLPHHCRWRALNLNERIRKMDKRQALLHVNSMLVTQVGSRFDSRYVPDSSVYILGCYEVDQDVWELMGVVQIQGDLYFLRQITRHNWAFLAEKITRIDIEGSTVELLERMYYGEGVTLTTGKDAVVVHPKTLRWHMEVLKDHRFVYRKPYKEKKEGLWSKIKRKLAA
ncbi:MAG: hypothetical protein ACR2HF_08910 [Methylococcaceae bacterium]